MTRYAEMTVIFDTDCVLCSRWVRFLLRHERDADLRFASSRKPVGCPAPSLWATSEHGFWNGRSHVQGLMWSEAIVLSEPGIDDDLSLFGGVGPFCVEDFPAKYAVDALIVSILPG